MKHRSRRKPTDFSVMIVTEHGETRAFVRDITESGIKIADYELFLMPGTKVDLVVRNRRCSGHVVWVDGRTAGLEMASPLPGDLKSLIGRDRNKARPARTGFGG